MKVLGRIGGNEIVLDKDDGNSALTLVTEFPDPTGDIRSIQIEVAIDGYKPGDIFLRKNSTSCTSEAITRMKKRVCKNSSPSGTITSL